MARDTWDASRSKAEREASETYRENLTIVAGDRQISISGIFDASADREARPKSPDGTFPVEAELSCWRADLGFVPAVDEVLRIARAAHPEDDQTYLVVSVDYTSDLLTIVLRAQASVGSNLF